MRIDEFFIKMAAKFECLFTLHIRRFFFRKSFNILPSEVLQFAGQYTVHVGPIGQKVLPHKKGADYAYTTLTLL
jgi:hypothetical protein